MKKIVLCNIMMKAEFYPFKYKVDGNSTIEYDGKVVFPINGVLAKTLKKGDCVKVILLKKEDLDRNSEKNVGEFKSELDRINTEIGAEIEYKILSTPHNESRLVQERLLKDIIAEFSDNAAIYADITYGTKSMPIIIFSALNFAEKFFKADIKNIIYGKVDFVKDKTTGKTNAQNPELFDMTALFYLNSIANTMTCKTSEQAVKLFNSILSED
ncbi:MAG: TM1812 family CRISPR-associated protein [Clostridia bacterium]|nr:TM1812 family CRISPR-associated protein [Clostridia bacterium]